MIIVDFCNSHIWHPPERAKNVWGDDHMDNGCLTFFSRFRLIMRATCKVST